jgi:hypothetical protein
MRFRLIPFQEERLMGLLTRLEPEKMRGNNFEKFFVIGCHWRKRLMKPSFPKKALFALFFTEINVTNDKKLTIS